MVCPDCEILAKKVAELEAKLARYENAHTPPSIRSGGFIRSLIPESEKKKSGGKPGHPGSTRHQLKPTSSIEVMLDNCAHCQAKLGKPFKIGSIIKEEVPEPQPVEVVDYRIGYYECGKCHRISVATHPSLPAQGRFGNNLLTEVSLSKFEERLPVLKIKAHLLRRYQLHVSAATIFDMTRRVSDKLLADYKQLAEEVRKSAYVYADETGIKVSGEKYWIWIFVTSTETLVLIRKSRAKKVVEEVLGPDYKGIIVCDGHTAYSQYSVRLQRCWAHLLREAKHLAKKWISAEHLLKGLKALFDKLKKVRSEAELVRKKAYDDALLELKQWVDYGSGYKELRKFASKIGRGLEHFLTFVLHPEVEPTNNTAERALREHVVIRKIIGTFRNTKGTTIHETLTSLIATWKQRGFNIQKMLKTALTT